MNSRTRLVGILAILGAVAPCLAGEPIDAKAIKLVLMQPKAIDKKVIEVDPGQQIDCVVTLQQPAGVKAPDIVLVSLSKGTGKGKSYYSQRVLTRNAKDPNKYEGHFKYLVVREELDLFAEAVYAEVDPAPDGGEKITRVPSEAVKIRRR